MPVAPDLRQLIPALIALAIAAPARAQDASRTRVIAALEHLMLTAEPRHNTHDEGEWLQAEVERAVARSDEQILQLARRAASPLIVRISSLVGSTGSLPWISIESVPVLTVPGQSAYRAQLFVSVDGAAPAVVGTYFEGLITGGPMDRLLPAGASAPGIHRLQFSARLTFSDGSMAREDRTLSEILYGIYDADSRSMSDPRVLIAAAMSADVRTLDPALPAEPFGVWMRATAKSNGGDFEPWREDSWTVQYCDERILEDGIRGSRNDLCAVALFAVPDGHNSIGRVWIRTGRVERGADGPVWLAERPAFEAADVRTTEVGQLSDLERLLATPSTDWPTADISVLPEDIRLTRDGARVRIEASVRNDGTAPARDVSVFLATVSGGTQMGRRTLVRTVPANGSLEIDVELPFTAAYGTVVVHAMQLSEHARPGQWSPDPTPDDSVAFRVVGLSRAPRGYLQRVLSECGACRGF